MIPPADDAPATAPGAAVPGAAAPAAAAPGPTAPRSAPQPRKPAPKSSRRRSRELALQGLYEWLIGKGEPGVVVAQIDPDGAAARKGLRPGDVILEAAGQPVTRPTDVQKALLDARKEGRKAVLLRVKSGEGTRFVALAANPAT